LLASDGVLEVLPDVAGTTKLQQLMGHFGGGCSIDAIASSIGIEPDEHYRDDVTLFLLERKAEHA
jgi:hypothetical protein